MKLSRIISQDEPSTCECLSGWEGPLCDRPVCSDGCHEENGFCEEVRGKDV